MIRPVIQAWAIQANGMKQVCLLAHGYRYGGKIKKKNNNNKNKQTNQQTKKQNKDILT